ncbi:hypothetical protein [Mucilaginibacter ginkgonis]|uniref:Lipocalin-like domain-containing protein n=1 Tax=Mucilaginibacter ginkgonis TaxID=2682091 RepID=A0A6I4I4Q2_9SPHI|nr:hypothetical protein [Mucilaginibacter ginkgonis]QQL48959.1 hypothetical protein GO620_012320 [Mucilaginibacter ginkgonis]
MKKTFQIALLLLAVTLAFTACGPTKTVVNGGSTRNHFVGTFTVTNVTYEGLVQGSVSSVFDQAPPQDFVGSTWQLTNSGNGIYTLNSGASQTIYWSLNDDNQTFQFKKIYQGDKAKNVTAGYQLVISANNASSFILKTPVSIGNSTGFVVYNFVRK